MTPSVIVFLKLPLYGEILMDSTLDIFCPSEEFLFEVVPIYIEMGFEGKSYCSLSLYPLFFIIKWE
jgi:hypothetical protein